MPSFSRVRRTGRWERSTSRFAIALERMATRWLTLGLLGGGAPHASSPPAPLMLFLSSRFSRVRSATTSRRRARLAAQVSHLVGGRGPGRVAREPPLAGVQELLGPGFDHRGGDPLAAAKLRDAVLAPQALQHDADPLLGRERAAARAAGGGGLAAAGLARPRPCRPTLPRAAARARSRADLRCRLARRFGGGSRPCGTTEVLGRPGVSRGTRAAPPPERDLEAQERLREGGLAEAMAAAAAEHPAEHPAERIERRLEERAGPEDTAAGCLPANARVGGKGRVRHRWRPPGARPPGAPWATILARAPPRRRRGRELGAWHPRCPSEGRVLLGRAAAMPPRRARRTPRGGSWGKPSPGPLPDPPRSSRAPAGTPTAPPPRAARP